MSIIIDHTAHTFTLHTAHTTYQMKVDELGVLLHTYYGPRTDGGDLSQLIYHFDRGFSGNPYGKGKTEKGYSLDVLPQEYSCFGAGDYRITALRVRQADGSRACDLRFADAAVSRGKYALPGLPAVHTDAPDAETLTITLRDPATGLEVVLLYGVLPELDVITRAAVITNGGTAPVVLEKAASLSLDWQYDTFDWVTFHGRHTMERNFQRMPLQHGVQSIGSVRGTSSHHYNPFAILCDPAATETSGLCYGVSFVYSGEFLMEAEKDQIGQTRLVCGIHPDDFAWPLEPGESFTTPETVLTCSGEGFGLLSRHLHTLTREHICRGPWVHKRRPVLLNNWEGTYFGFAGDKLVAMAKQAADLGVELFVLDDGWFGKRDDDNSGLGDWFPNEKKLGCSLGELARRIRQTGLAFGLWFEPEAVSEDSDLYRAHPDWAVQIPGRRPNLSRNQLVLDLSRTEVQDYLIERLCALTQEAGLTYIKWDMNRSICDKYSAALDAAHQGQFSHKFLLGLYRVLETLHQRFPDLLIEGCSGGGGRFDLGMLYYTPQIWCSDNSDAVARLDIQYGTSFGYPCSAMGAHVSAVPNHQTGRVTPLETRACVAMAGTFGYELDPDKLTETDKSEIRAQIARFHQYYDLLQYGDYYRLRAPVTGCSVWEVAAPDGSEALVTAVYKTVEANAGLVRVQIQGLTPDARYTVTLLQHEGTDQPHPEFLRPVTLTGRELALAGMVVPPARRDYQAWQLHITRC
ncbi:alpha-galactosidase [Subdoligranulum variabile]|uniref:alpha-galactosidase n=1 Tax=Subdoligranulum variabile TaxID=214851 RepID=UPI0026EA9432|nr:alpha-galactosidase [Subdoligranulum variabile]